MFSLNFSAYLRLIAKPFVCRDGIVSKFAADHKKQFTNSNTDLSNDNLTKNCYIYKNSSQKEHDGLTRGTYTSSLQLFMAAILDCSPNFESTIIKEFLKSQNAENLTRNVLMDDF